MADKSVDAETRAADHVAFAIWLGLICAAFSLAVDYRIGSSPRNYAYAIGGGGSVWVGFVTPCIAYFLFRLVRPFSFTTKNPAPANSLYWLGVLIGTLSIAATATYLSWTVLQPALLGYYRIAGLVLPLSTVAGLLFLEASIVRERNAGSTSAPYADAGLLSSLLIAPALLMWFLNVSPQSKAGTAIYGLFAKDSDWFWQLPALVAAGIFALWWGSSRVRRRCRGSAAYRAFTSAFWIFGITSYLLFGVTARMKSVRDFDSAGGVLYNAWTISQTNPLLFLGGVAIAWLAVSGTGYLVLRRRASA